MKTPKIFDIEGKKYALIDGELRPMVTERGASKIPPMDYNTFKTKLSSFSGEDWIRETGFIDKENPLNISHESVKALYNKYNVQYKGEPVKRQSIPYSLKVERLSKIAKHRKVPKKTLQSYKSKAISFLEDRIKVANNKFISKHLEEAVSLVKETL